MRYLSCEEEKEAGEYIAEAMKIALFSRCLRSKCGVVIVKDKKIIGERYNSPPQSRYVFYLNFNNIFVIKISLLIPR